MALHYPSHLTLARLAAVACAIAGAAAAAGPQADDRAALHQAILSAEDTRAPRAEDVRMLLDAAGARDEDVAVAAVRALGRLERPALAGDLMAFLDAKSPLVRAEAVNAVVQSVAGGDDGAVERARAVLTSRLSTEKEPRVRGVVCETLGRMQYANADAVRGVEAALVDASLQTGPGVAARPSSSTTALGAPAAGVTIGIGTIDRNAPLPVLIGAAKGLEALIRRHGGTAPPGGRTVARLRSLVETARPPSDRPEALSREAVAEYARVRRLALQALVAAGAADERTIARGVRDEDSQVRRLAVQAAGAAPGAAPDLAADRRESIVRRGLGDREPIVRSEAVRAYGRALQKTRGCGPLIRAMEDRDLHVALGAIDQLASGCTEPAAAVVSLAAQAGSVGAGGGGWHRAAHAIVALAALSRERAAAVLPSFAGHAIWQVRMYAARAYPALGDAAALERLASDSHANVREAAVSGLVAVSGHGADATYLAALESTDYQLVRTAARALKGTPARERAAPALLAALARITAERRDTSRDPRLAIVDALGELGSAADAPAIEPYLKDFDPRVAAAAAMVLTAWTGQPRDAETRRFEPAPAPRWSDIAKLEGALASVVMKGGGTFEMALLPQEAPATVDRFVRLARQGYYDGLTFHRVVANFVIQGGSPGANEYAGDGPYMRDEVGLMPHRRGAVGISTRGRDTGDAQIFIDLVDNPRLDHAYTVFAEVVRGMDVVDRIAEGDAIARVEIVKPGS